MSAHPPGDDPKSKRVHKRFEVDWRVSLTCKDWRMAGRVAASNASRGGLFLFTPRPPPMGTVVELTVQLPDGQSLRLQGTVAHVVTAEEAARSGKGAGVGVKFDDKHQVDLLLLEEMASAGLASAAPPAHDPEPERPELQSHVGPLPPPPPEAAGPAAAAPRPARPSTPITRPSSPGAEADDGSPSQRPARTSRGPATALGRIAVAQKLPADLPVCPVLGIDFGTTYTSVSVAIGELVHLIPDGEGRVLQPSIVSYPEKGPRVTGWAARERQAHDPRHTVSSVKRLLGQKHSDPGLAGYLQSLPYRTLAGPGDQVLIELEGERYAVPQVVAAMLSHVRDQAESALERRFDKVSLSYPVAFAEEQKLALRRAAQLAGLEVVAMVPEPVAGALAYGIGQAKNEIVAVYDFGGGTFDFSLLDISGDQVRVLVTDGDSWLGGDDFDFVLASAVADAFWRATKIELRQRAVEWQRLLLGCEKVKRDLSNEPQGLLVVEQIVETPKRLDLRQKVDRALFQRLTQELFDRSLEVCRGALGRAGLDPADVTQLVVTGGVSRIPYVREGLGGFFGREVLTLVNPEEAIVLGAGMKGAQAVEHAVRGVAKR